MALFKICNRQKNFLGYFVDSVQVLDFKYDNFVFNVLVLDSRAN